MTTAVPAPIASALLSEDEASATAALFRVLADPARVRIVNLLANRDGPACICELVDELSLAQPTVSHHLKLLVDAGLIVGEKRGRWVWYRPVPERLTQLRRALD